MHNNVNKGLLWTLLISLFLIVNLLNITIVYHWYNYIFTFSALSLIGLIAGILIRERKEQLTYKDLFINVLDGLKLLKGYIHRGYIFLKYPAQRFLKIIALLFIISIIKYFASEDIITLSHEAIKFINFVVMIIVFGHINLMIVEIAKVMSYKIKVDQVIQKLLMTKIPLQYAHKNGVYSLDVDKMLDDCYKHIDELRYECCYSFLLKNQKYLDGITKTQIDTFNKHNRTVIID